jgi:hypothetical protein
MPLGEAAAPGVLDPGVLDPAELPVPGVPEEQPTCGSADTAARPQPMRTDVVRIE